DSLSYSTEKSLKDLGDKVEASTRTTVEAALADLKKAMEGDDVADIKAKSDALTQASHKLAEAMYQQANQGEQAGAAGGEGAGEQAGGGAQDDDVVDADFEEVNEEKK
ncbi:MAG: Hsp70 family protein, partial [Desulfosarcinaceae bacterium]